MAERMSHQTIQAQNERKRSTAFLDAQIMCKLRANLEKEKEADDKKLLKSS